jgi:multidrug efflux system membrane fusion protein
MFAPRSAESTNDKLTNTPRAVIAISEGQNSLENTEILTVRATRIGPQSYVEKVRVRGRTRASRHVQVRAEESGRIVSEPIPRGARVSQGDILCEIAVDNRQANLQEALSRGEQAEFEYKASLDLQERGLQSDVAVAQLKTALESSKTAINRTKLALEKTKILAPFDGIVETRTVEIGDLLNAGTVCASVLDDTPMLLVGLVPEQEVSGIQVGAKVTGKLLSGEYVEGTVNYLARAADAISRSYRVEIEVDSKYENLREGITVELMVETRDIQAHLIPSSALTLNDSGEIAVKTIDESDLVSSHIIEIVGDNTSLVNPGIWVTGLNGSVNLVTLGQEIVFPGQTVESNFDWDN